MKGRNKVSSWRNHCALNINCSTWIWRQNTVIISNLALVIQQITLRIYKLHSNLIYRESKRPITIIAHVQARRLLSPGAQAHNRMDQREETTERIGDNSKQVCTLYCGGRTGASGWRPAACARGGTAAASPRTTSCPRSRPLRGVCCCCCCVAGSGGAWVGDCHGISSSLAMGEREMGIV